MGQLELVSNSEAETEAIGKKLSQALFPGAFIALFGGLGAGKTAFARGVGKGLGVNDIISPTFAIIHEHEGRLPLCHIDAYRLLNTDELLNVGYEEYLSGDYVIIMEWPDLVYNALPCERLDIYISGSGSESRSITLVPSDSKHASLIEALKMGDAGC